MYSLLPDTIKIEDDLKPTNLTRNQAWVSVGRLIQLT